MKRQPPECETCRRHHWEIMSKESAARHCHMSTERFRQAIDDGHGPGRWAHDVYVHPRYHVNELDRWLAATKASKKGAA